MNQEEVSREVAIAADNNKKIIYIRIENIKPEKDLTFYLSNIQWLDAFGHPDDETLDKLVKRLITLVSPLDEVESIDKASIDARVRIAELEKAILQAIKISPTKNLHL